MFSFFSRKPEATYKVMTFRGAANGWQTRHVATADRAVRLRVLLDRIQPQLIHKFG